MQHRKSRNKTRRSVYPYTCTGCSRKRIAFDYARAKAQLCRRCETPKVHPDQTSLPL